jgi:hypothetical protein
MSNPLRQSLYTLDNCLNGGEFKATAAVESLKRIFPAVVGHQSIPKISKEAKPYDNIYNCMFFFSFSGSGRHCYGYTNAWTPS